MTNQKYSVLINDLQNTLLQEEEVWRRENTVYNAMDLAQARMENALAELDMAFINSNEGLFVHEHLYSEHYPILVNCNDCGMYLFTMIAVITDPHHNEHIIFSDADDFYGLQTRGLVTVKIPADLIRAEMLELVVTKVRLVCSSLTSSHVCYEEKKQ